jgi:hypothetical protein
VCVRWRESSQQATTRRSASAPLARSDAQTSPGRNCRAFGVWLLLTWTPTAEQRCCLPAGAAALARTYLRISERLPLHALRVVHNGGNNDHAGVADRPHLRSYRGGHDERAGAGASGGPSLR